MYKFKVGDRVICNGDDISDLDIIYEPGVVEDVLKWFAEGKWPAQNGYFIRFDYRDLTDGGTWVVPEDSLEYESDKDKEIWEFKEKNRKLNKLKYKNIDPFEEEIWEQYEFVQNKPKFKVGDRVICEGIQDGLNIDGYTGIISWVGQFKHENLYTVNFDEEFSNRLDEENSWNVTEKQIRIYDDKEEEIRTKRRKESSLKNIDKDPFQEEIWEGIKKYKKFI